MLQITVKVFKDKTRYVSHITKDGQILSVFDKNEKKIDLSVLQPFVGETFEMKTCVQGNKEDEFTNVKTEMCKLLQLSNDNGLWKFTYDTDNLEQTLMEAKQ